MIHFPLIARRWRSPKVLIALMVLELPLTVGCLVLYGIADGDTYRTKLWQNGYDKGFNSPPNEILYDYANHRPAHVPIIWSSYLVQFNTVISVFSMFVLLAKSTMYVLHWFLPIISVLAHLLCLIIYIIALVNQSSHDMSDPDHPNPGLAWYLSKGCGYAEKGNYGYCMQMRAAYGMTIVMIVLFFIYLVVSLYSLRPTPEERAAREAERAESLELKRMDSYAADPEIAGLSKEERWERNRQIFLNLPKTPNTPGFGRQNPMTPRTVAFTQLNGGPAGPAMPGRARQMSPASKSPGGGLKFREEYSEVPVPDAR